MTDDVAGRVACMLAWLGLAALPGSGLTSTGPASRTWSIQGQVLELFDAAGTPVAVLEAVYLR